MFLREQSFFDEKEVSQVNVPATDGEFGVLPNHVPVIATLKPGVVTVVENNAEAQYFGTSTRPLVFCMWGGAPNAWQRVCTERREQRECE